MKIIFTTISFLLVSTIATAVCLKGHPSIAEEYSQCQSVFIGKVINKKDVPESGGFYDGDDNTVQVQEVFKGKPKKTIVIFSENSSGRFPMDVGKTYIIFLHYYSGRYQIDNCGNSGLLTENQETITSIRALKKGKTK